MPPKRGQPPKPPQKSRTELVAARYTPEEMAILKEAYELSESTTTLARWVVETSLEEAKKIIASRRLRSVESETIEFSNVTLGELTEGVKMIFESMQKTLDERIQNTVKEQIENELKGRDR